MSTPDSRITATAMAFSLSAFSAGAENFGPVTGVVTEPAFGHLAAAGVSGAEEEDFAGHTRIVYVTGMRRKQAISRSSILHRVINVWSDADRTAAHADENFLMRGRISASSRHARFLRRQR